MDNKKEVIDSIFQKTTKNKLLHEAVLLVEDSYGKFSHHLEYGGKGIDTPFLIASITKLFTTSCIFILKDQGRLSLDDPLIKYIDKEKLQYLHIYRGQEFSEQLTIAHLLCHTSGLPDAIEEGSHRAKKRAIKQDIYTDFEETLKNTRNLKPRFEPETKNKAHYANINFDILGKIIEVITNSTLEDVYQRFIFDPLDLKHTYLPVHEHDNVPKFYYKDVSYYRPKIIKSIRASGGVVSTTRELMLFIKAFFQGELFSISTFHEWTANHRLQVPMMPIHYDVGYMRISLEGWSTFFMGKGDVIGHSGSTGAFAFYYPQADLFFVGDLNQMANPALPVRLVMRLAMALNKIKET